MPNPGLLAPPDSHYIAAALGWLARSLAWKALLPAAERFPQNSLVWFNLACLACQVQKPQETWLFLQKALDRGDAEEIKKMALAEPELKTLGPKIRKG